MRIKDHKNPR